MAINLSDNIHVSAPKPVESKYLNITVPYTSCSEVNSCIVSGERYPGLTVNINNVDYWYCAGVSDGNLVIKTSSATGTVTGATNGLSLAGISGTSIALGGNLTTGTTINGVGIHNLTISNINEFQVKTSGDSTVFGVDNSGFLISFSGGSVTFDDNGGLKYGSDYSSGFTSNSLVNASYVTGLTTSLPYLKLDQTIEQTVINGQPTFGEGIIFGTGVTPSLISGHTVGKAYYDSCYETISIQLGKETTLQVGEESLQYVWAVVDIPNGAVVKLAGTHYGGGICADVSSICLAQANTITNARVLGVATQNISASTYGFITQRGYVHELNTTTSLYSGITAGQEIYLSSTVLGGVTNIPPSSPNILEYVGHMIMTGITDGTISVQPTLIYSLDDLSDVVAISPSIDDVLKWNGSEWVNAMVGTTSAGSGTNFYFATPMINIPTGAPGLSQNGTLGNGVAVMSLSKSPVTTPTTGCTISGCVNAAGTYAFVAWLYDTPLGRSTIDSGTWDFTSWLCVSAAGGTETIINNAYQVVPISGITISNVTANAVRATITNSGFTGAYFSASTTNINASWLQTKSGIYQICEKINDNNVCIVKATTHTVSGGTGNTWNKLFGATSIDLTAPYTSDYVCTVTTLAEPNFSISCTDKLGRIGFGYGSAARLFGVTYNGTNKASYFKTPLITLHNDLAGLQGGTGSQRYHITQTQNTLLAGITATATEINVLSGIPPTLNSTELGYVDGVTSSIQTQLNSKSNTGHTHSYYQTASGFTSYTASTSPILNTAITGITNYGGGESVYKSISGHTLNLNTIIGSGSTTVQKIGNEIIIFSSGASSGGIYEGESPTVCTVGGLPSSTSISGCTISCVLSMILVPEIFGTLTAPSISIGLIPSTSTYEVGCAIPTLDVTGTFNRGSINPQGCSTSPYRSGLASCYVFTGAQVAGSYACTSSPVTKTATSYSIISGAQTWTIATCYSCGVQPLGSKGTPFNTPLISGCTSTASASITGIYPYYYGKITCGIRPAITNSLVTGGTKNVADSIGTVTVTFSSSAQWTWVAIPAISTSKTCWYVNALDNGKINNAPSDKYPDECSVAITSGQGCWTGINYKVYMSGFAATDATAIQFRNS